ncbi:MAG TPA: hypothetical protein PKE69_28295, partial [Pyrinomonadaceae bacterium]|nr:hypothetical protein [Pyrinomonadaceae bacterium]
MLRFIGNFSDDGKIQEKIDKFTKIKIFTSADLFNKGADALEGVSELSEFEQHFLETLKALLAISE